MVNIPLLLTLVAFLAYLSVRNKDYIDGSAKSEVYATNKEDVEACKTNRTDMAVAKEEQELCRCGRHWKSANYFCVESIYYDDSDSEEEAISPPSTPLAHTPSPKTKSGSGKKVTFSRSTVFEPSRNVDPPKRSEPIIIPPTVLFPKHPELNRKLSRNLASQSLSYFEPLPNPYPRRTEIVKKISPYFTSRIDPQALAQVGPIIAPSTPPSRFKPPPAPYTKRQESIGKVSENLTSLTKAQAVAQQPLEKASTTPHSTPNPIVDPSSIKISELEALLAAQGAKHTNMEDENRRLRTTITNLQSKKKTVQPSQLDDEERKELAGLKAGFEKALKDNSELEIELSRQRTFTAEAYAELEKLEKSQDVPEESVQLREQLKTAQEEKQQLLSQLRVVEDQYEQKEATLVSQAEEYRAGLDKEKQQLQTELEGVHGELNTAKTKASEDQTAYNNLVDELSGVRGELDTTKTQASKDLTSYNNIRAELSGVREELRNTRDDNETAYNALEAELSGVRADLLKVTLERDRAQWHLQQREEEDATMEPESDEEQDADMEPESGEEQDSRMEPQSDDKRVEEVKATLALFRIEFNDLAQNLTKKTDQLQESKKQMRIKAKQLKDVTTERDELKKEKELEVGKLRNEVRRLEKLVDAVPGLRQAPKVASTMDYTKATQKQLVREVRKVVQEYEELKIDGERNRREGKREGFEEGLKAGKMELAEQLVPIYLNIGTRMARDFSPEDLCTEPIVRPGTITVMTEKQTKYSELLELQKDLSRLMGETGLPAVRKVGGKGRARVETDEELFNLQSDRFFSKRLLGSGKVQSSTSNAPKDSTMSDRESMLPSNEHVQG